MNLVPICAEINVKKYFAQVSFLEINNYCTLKIYISCFLSRTVQVALVTKDCHILSHNFVANFRNAKKFTCLKDYLGCCIGWILLWLRRIIGLCRVNEDKLFLFIFCIKTITNDCIWLTLLTDCICECIRKYYWKVK